MSAPYFSNETKETLAARSGMICNNPSCSSMTVGPTDANGRLSTKLGEAAHICAAKEGEARYVKSMNDEERSSIENGIWLCASCHTMIDKNKGVDYPESLVREWKENHERIIKSLLITHRSPLPLLRRFTDEGKVAQDVVDFLEGHGSLYVSFNQESNDYVVESFSRIRSGMTGYIKEVHYDLQLKSLLKELRDEFRKYMNFTGNFSHNNWNELQSVRNHVGAILKRLRDEFGCRIYGNMNNLIN
jgi:hypothetical protein